MTRAIILREFRDFVLEKNGLQDQPAAGSSAAHRHNAHYNGVGGGGARSSHSSHGGRLLAAHAPPQHATPKKFQPDNLILVGLRTAGAAGGALVDNLCGLVRDAVAVYEEQWLKSYPRETLSRFTVDCIVPSELNFLEEIKHARRAKIIVSMHGTISYMSLFSREGTQQISIANPKEYKENQILLYATHVQLHYLTWDRLSELHKVLTLAITLSNAYYQEI